MPDIDDISKAIEELLEWLKKQRGVVLLPAQKADLELALADLVVAVGETKDFISKGRVSGAVSPEDNLYVASLWGKAARSVQMVDFELSNRLLLKQDAWRNANQWPGERVNASRIAIEDVDLELRRMLRSLHGG